MSIDTKWLVNLSKAKSWKEAETKFFNQISSLQQKGKLTDVPISGNDFITLLTENFDSEFDQKTWKKFLFLKSNDKTKLFVSYDWENIWYFDLDDNWRTIFWEFVKSLLSYANEKEKNRSEKIFWRTARKCIIPTWVGKI
jgi:hypothetical protein